VIPNELLMVSRSSSQIVPLLQKVSAYIQTLKREVDTLKKIFDSSVLAIFSDDRLGT